MNSEQDRARLAEQLTPAGTGDADRVDPIRRALDKLAVEQGKRSSGAPHSAIHFASDELLALGSRVAKADRVEGLREAARDVLAIWDDQRDVPWMIDADKRMEALRAALDGDSGQEGRS